MRGTGEDELDEDFGPDDPADDPAPPYWFPGTRMPDEARRIGLTHHVPDGALLDFATKLDSSRASHRAIAWVLLVVFCFPVLTYVVRLVDLLAVHRPGTDRAPTGTVRADGTGLASGHGFPRRRREVPRRARRPGRPGDREGG